MVAELIDLLRTLRTPSTALFAVDFARVRPSSERGGRRGIDDGLLSFPSIPTYRRISKIYDGFREEGRIGGEPLDAGVYEAVDTIDV